MQPWNASDRRLTPHAISCVLAMGANWIPLQSRQTQPPHAMLPAPLVTAVAASAAMPGAHPPAGTGGPQMLLTVGPGFLESNPGQWTLSVVSTSTQAISW